MDEQAISENGNRRRILDGRGYGHWPSFAIFRCDLRVRREFCRRVHSQSHAIMTRMVDGLMDFDVTLLSADCFRDHITRLAPIRIGSTARTRLLRVAAVVLDQPGGGFQKFKVCGSALNRYSQPADQDKESNRSFHRSSPF